jgi:hypothetical protein
LIHIIRHPLPQNAPGLETYDTSNIIIEGDVVTVDTNVVGTGADCYESQCKLYSDGCRANAWCSTMLMQVEVAVAKGDDFMTSMKIHAGTANEHFKALYTCAGLANSDCNAGTSSVSFKTAGSTTYPTVCGNTPSERASTLVDVSPLVAPQNNLYSIHEAMCMLS